jgi:3-oxoacyl-[acyl-carrier protein] reductase
MTFKPLDNLNGQTAVITGANGGIGFATASALAHAGATIVGICHRRQEELQNRLDQLPGTHTALIADVTDSDSLIQVAGQIPHCDILVTSAGHSRPIPHSNLDALTDELFDDILIANLRSVFATVKAFVPLLKQSNNALIVNVSSASAINPGHGSNIAYVSAKAGVDAMTKNLALALAPAIRVVSVSPSAINTGFLDMPEEFYQRSGQATPLKRVGVPEDIASAIEAVATKLRFTTGNSFVIDGGRFL